MPPEPRVGSGNRVQQNGLKTNRAWRSLIPQMASDSLPHVFKAVWLTREADAFCLSLHCQPGAKQTRVCGLHGDRLKVALAAPAVDNQANSYLLRWLADLFEVPKDRVTLLSGQTSRQKRVRLIGVSLDQVCRVLGDNEALPTRGST
jgi:uncharacterized protein (TIGR00251 family)